MVSIADSGFLIALFGKPAERAWALKEFEIRDAPFLTCEAALAEAAHFVDSVWLAQLLEDGDIQIAFSAQEEHVRLVQLLKKYRDQMDFADACIVRMSEIFPNCSVLTVDEKHFSIYRRFGNQTIPISTPKV
jgi:uncharacterized protein